MPKDTRRPQETRTSWPMRRGLAATAALLLAALAAAPAATAAIETATATVSAAPTGNTSFRGQLVSVTPVAAHSRAEVVRYLAALPMDTDPVRYGVRAYRLTGFLERKPRSSGRG
ncbi:hypothetical protein [Streptomyces sp. NPDC058424]|uniref:hypothetical protein n=1 Tax=Streptomyces sp. NPDC058424 TaxID=3346491 RepID=UPI003646A10F